MNSFGDKLTIDKSKFSICPKSNEKYQLLNNMVKIIDE